MLGQLPKSFPASPKRAREYVDNKEDRHANKKTKRDGKEANDDEGDDDEMAD
jgi:hypothetical protein